MIYLLRSPAWEKDRGYFQILKIGWSDDTKYWKKKSKRKDNYKSHNPTSEMLVQIPGLSINVEEALHDKFSIHKYGEMDEWYEFVPEIIDFFSSPDIYQQLLGLETIGLNLRRKKEWKRKEEIYNYFFKNYTTHPPISYSTSALEWIGQVKSILSPVDYINLESDLEYFENLMSKDIKEVFEKIVKADKRGFEKVKEVLDTTLEWMDESDFMQLINLINNGTREQYNKTP